MTRQLELFRPPRPGTATTCDTGIPGLRYAPLVLTPEEQAAVLLQVDANPWSSELRRRVQHYGYRYDYKARRINEAMFVGPLPRFAVEVARRLVERGLLPEMPDQLIVNEYQPGQGITAHVDCEPCFKETIATVSLGWDYEMEFRRVGGEEACSLLLERGSTLVLSGEARYRWTHAIKARQSDRGVRRHRRVSLTYRNVILDRESARAASTRPTRA